MPQIKCRKHLMDRNTKLITKKVLICFQVKFQKKSWILPAYMFVWIRGHTMGKYIWGLLKIFIHSNVYISQLDSAEAWVLAYILLNIDENKDWYAFWSGLASILHSNFWAHVGNRSSWGTFHHVLWIWPPLMWSTESITRNMARPCHLTSGLEYRLCTI